MKNAIFALALLASFATPSFAQDNAIKGLYAGMPIEEFKDKVSAMGGSFAAQTSPSNREKDQRHLLRYNMDTCLVNVYTGVPNEPFCSSYEGKYEVTVGGARIKHIDWIHTYGDKHVLNFEIVDEDRKTAWEAIYAKYGRHDDFASHVSRGFRTLSATNLYIWNFDNNNRLEMKSTDKSYPYRISLVRDDVKDGDKNDF